MHKKIFLLGLLLAGLGLCKSQNIINVISQAVYYDGYAATVSQPVPPGLIRLANTKYSRKLTDSELNSLKAKITLDIRIGALCDNYDRIGDAYLALVPKNQTTYTADDNNVKRIEIARYITPFMNKNIPPTEVPYTYDVSNLYSVFHDSQIRSAYDIYMELEVFGVPYKANEQVAGCKDRNDVFTGTLNLTSTDTASPSDYNTLVPILAYNKLNNYNNTDVAGQTVRITSFDLPAPVTNASFFVISTPHGANPGGEEYNRRQNYTYIDDVQMLTYTPGGKSCEPYRIYNTHPNGIYGSYPLTTAQWTSWNNWCPGDAVPIRSFTMNNLAAGTHTLRHTIPTAVFNQKQGSVYLSVYMQAKAEGALSVKDIKNIDVTIYPNPTSDFVHVKSKIETASLSLFDMDGKKLSEISKNNTINISGYKSGNYLLTIVLKDGTTFTHTIIKK